MISTSTKSPITLLPLETLSQIISYIPLSDKKTLSACSLASWLFVPACRYVMFSNVKLGYTNEEVKEFVRLLRSERSSVRGVTRCLRFGATVKDMRSSRSYQDQSTTEEDDESGVLTGGFESVRIVEFEGVLPPSSSPEIGRCTSAFWMVVNELRGVKEVRAESRSLVGNGLMLLKWVCELRELEEISVVTLRGRSQVNAVGSSAAPHIRGAAMEEMMQLRLKNPGNANIKALELRGWNDLCLLRWMLDHTSTVMPRVRNLKIGRWDAVAERNGGGVLLRRLFEVCGSGIRHLCVEIPEPGETDILESLSLSHCENLQSIRVEGLRVGPSNRKDQRVSLELLLEKLFNSSPDQVKRVALGIRMDPHIREAFAFFGIPDLSLFKAFDWGRVTDILEQAWLKGGDTNARWAQGGPLVSRGRDHGRELVLHIQGGSKFGREKLEGHLRRDVFRVFDERVRFSVMFDEGI